MTDKQLGRWLHAKPYPDEHYWWEAMKALVALLRETQDVIEAISDPAVSFKTFLRKQQELEARLRTVLGG